MRIKIDHKKLQAFPYNQENKDSFIFDDKYSIDQIKQEISNGTPNVYFVSGYRGAGKTSFLKKLEAELLDNVVFVFVSFAKFTNYSLMIRKIIRSLYIQLQRTRKFKEYISKNIDFETALDLLYDRTFSNVNYIDLLSKSETNKVKYTMTVNLWKILLTVCALFSVFNFFYLVIPSTDSRIFSVILFATSISLFYIDKLNLTFDKSSEKNKSIEINRKSLYDDEIAEYHLINILKELSANSFNIVVVFDELDKIENLEDIDTIIKEFKGLLLSGYANFILVPGQKLYYEVQKSHFTDDPILLSLFGNSYHVSLFSYELLIKLLNAMILDKDDINKEILRNYIDSVILTSGFVTRKIFNSIRSNIIWVNNESFLNIEEINSNRFKLNSEILQIILKIKEKDLSYLRDDLPAIDFFMIQLCLWVRKMEKFQNQRFQISNVFVRSEYEQVIQEISTSQYPNWYLIKLAPLCDILFKELVENKILYKSVENAEEFYEWPDLEQTFEKESYRSSITDIKYVFLENFIELEKHLRRVYVDVAGNEIQPNINLKKIVLKLTDLNVLPGFWYTNARFFDIVDLRNNLVHGNKIDQIESKDIESGILVLNRLKEELLENYVYYVLKIFFKNIETSQLSKGNNFEFISNIDNVSVLFDIWDTQNKSLNAKDINSMIYKFVNYKEMNRNYDVHYVIFLFNINPVYDNEDFVKYINDSLSEMEKGLSDHFHFYYGYDFVNDVSTKSIINFLISEIQPKLAKANDMIRFNQVNDNFVSDNNMLDVRKNDIRPIFIIKSYMPNSDPIRIRLVNISKRARLISVSIIHNSEFSIYTNPSVGNYIDTNKNLLIEIPQNLKISASKEGFKVKIEFSDIDSNIYNQIIDFVDQKFVIDDPVAAK